MDDDLSLLHGDLLNALQGQLQNGQKLFDELIQQAARLQALLNVPPRSAQEEAEINSGKITLNGRSLVVNQDFVTQVLFVSQQLSCSERYIAGVVRVISDRSPTIAVVEGAEQTVIEFYRRRRALVDVLRVLFEATEAAEGSNPPQLCKQLAAYVHNTILASGDSFAARIFREMEGLSVTLTAAEAKRQGAPTNTGNNMLARNVVDARCRSLQYERRTLAHVLTIMARLGLLSAVDIQKQIDWLSTNSQASLSHYIFTATSCAFDPADPSSPAGQSRTKLALDKSFMEYLKRKLDLSTTWAEPGLKSALLLKWTLLLTETQSTDASLQNRPGFRNEDTAIQFWNAVQGDAFTYLLGTIAHLERKRADYARFRPGTAQVEQDKREIPPEDFKLMLYLTIEALVRQTINHEQLELRKIKQRQEDLLVSGTRTDRHRMFRGSSSSYQTITGGDTDKPQGPPRNDVAVFFNLIGALYAALPPESGLQFWTSAQASEGSSYLELIEAASPKMFSFLSWAATSTQPRDVDMTSAMYNMFAGISTGQHCSEMTYNYMVRGGGDGGGGGSNSTQSSQYATGAVSWANMFSRLGGWNDLIRQQPQRQASSQQQQHLIGPQDVLLAQAFLNLLSTVVKHSVAARAAICGHPHLRAINTLMALIPLAVPLELKGAIFDTLAAFCLPGAGKQGAEICRLVWLAMEQMEVIDVRGIGGMASNGVEVEFEEVEAVHYMYPSTIPFLKLLCTLIHTPKLIPSSIRTGEYEPVNKIPEQLGQPYRQVGILPYSTFVIDTVFSKVSNREYLRPSDRWEIYDDCLAFIERCLASFDLEGLVAVAEQPEARKVVLQALAIHPGYDVMKHLLMRSALQENILKFVADGVEMFDKDFPEQEPLFASNVTRVLRIVHRVLQVQDIFIDVLVPLLIETEGATSLVGEIPMRSSLVRLDEALSYDARYASSIATYVTFPQFPELVILAVRTLALMSNTSAFSNLSSLIERSEDSDRILEGFTRLLLTGAMEDVRLSETLVDRMTGAGAPDPDAAQPLGQAMRLTILDLLLQSTKAGRAQPNIAHFLLFGTSKPVQHIKDPHEQDATSTCIHAVLHILNMGIPQRRGKGKERAVFEMGQTPPLFMTHPTLIERCYHLIHNLCVHPGTSEPVMRYLRTHEDFFARHLAAVSFHVPEVVADPAVQLVYGDGSRLITTVETVSSFLGLRAWIMELVALELLTLTRKGHQKSAGELLVLLFDTSEGYSEEDEYDDPVGTLFRPFRELGQSNMRVIELLQSQEFEWFDSVTVEAIDLQLLAHVNLLLSLRTDETGCEIVEETALLMQLDNAKTELRSYQERDPKFGAHLNAEIEYILKSCVIENNRRRIRFAQNSGYEAWKRLLEIALTNCFDRLPYDRRENLLFDLLHVLPTIVQSPNIQENTAILLSESILFCITKLREDRRHQIMMQSAGGDANAGSLPAERLYGLLRSILECILGHNRIELVRGNLYASLINYLYLITSTKVVDTPVSSASNGIGGLARSFSVSSIGSELLVSGRSTPVLSGDPNHGRKSASNLEGGTLAVLKGSLDRLISYVCRDAVDGSEVWKTVSFMLLDALVQISKGDRTHATLQSLVRRGYLSNFVRGLKESDLVIQGVLKPEPDDLNALYVYESKMSFLMRVAETRAGAERLLEARLLPTLADCDYVDARPQVDPSFMDMDSFLPSAILRYHQLLVPALQLALSMMTTLGQQHASATTQTLDFLSAHRDTFVILLKNDDSVIPLSMVEELHLVVSLCTSVASYVPKEELTSSSGYGAIHAAILGLGARCIGNGRLTQTIMPMTDGELLDASVRITNRSPDTVFDKKTRRAEGDLRRALLTYLGSIGEPGDVEPIPVLSSVVIPPRGEDRSSHFVATTPTIGDAIQCLRSMSAELAASLKHISDLSAELQHREMIRVDGVEDKIAVPKPEHWSSFDMAQKRALVAREYERIRTEETGKAQGVLDGLEMLLLLILQHVEFFSTTGRLSGELPSLSKMAMGKSMAKSLRFAPPTNAVQFRAEVAKQIGPVLQDLEAIDIGESIPVWRSSRPYIEIMCRRLRDSTDLHQKDVES